MNQERKRAKRRRQKLARTNKLKEREHLREPSCKRKLFAESPTQQAPIIQDTPPSSSPEEHPPKLITEPVYSEIDTSDEEGYQVRFEEQREEAAVMRQTQANKEILHERSYGSYTDSSPAVMQDAIDQTAVKAIERLPPIDRVAVKSYIGGIRSNERYAVQTARQFRSHASELKKELLDHKAAAHQEKESVRYFWRQQLLEGCSRSGQMVRKALQKKKKLQLKITIIVINQ